RVARGGAQLELRAGGLWRRLTAAGMAAPGPVKGRCLLPHGLLASPPLELGPPRVECLRAAILVSVGARRRGRDPERPRPRLRADLGGWRAGVRGRHRRSLAVCMAGSPAPHHADALQPSVWRAVDGA